MAETNSEEVVRCPAVAMQALDKTRERRKRNVKKKIQYGPCTVKDLKEGDLKKWCTCGLSKKQPWCDSAHKGTGFKSLKWTVPKTQSLYQICMCKHTKTPPYCDGTHTSLPEVVLERQRLCKEKRAHSGEEKLCTGCGWVPDF